MLAKKVLPWTKAWKSAELGLPLWTWLWFVRNGFPLNSNEGHQLQTRAKSLWIRQGTNQSNDFLRSSKV